MSTDILMAIPTCGPPHWPCVNSYIGIEMPAGAGLLFRTCALKPLDVARNALVRDFLKSHAEWLLCVDSDVVFRPGSLLRLLSWGQPIVSALNFSRRQPILPHVFRGESASKPRHYQLQAQEIYDWVAAHPDLQTCEPALLEPRPEDALTPVDFTGCSFLLIQRRVLETVTPPWFELNQDCAGEDYYFFRKAAAAGFAAYVDRSVVVAQLPGEHPVGALDFVAWYSIAEEEQHDSNDGGDQPQSHQS